MKLIDLQTIMDGDQILLIEQHDGYCMSVDEAAIQVKDLENSKLKDEEVDLISSGTRHVICIRLKGTYR